MGDKLEELNNQIQAYERQYVTIANQINELQNQLAKLRDEILFLRGKKQAYEEMSGGEESGKKRSST